MSWFITRLSSLGFLGLSSSVQICHGYNRSMGSGALEVFERRGQAERLVQDERAAVHGLDYVPAA
jgi:hypothetical protein